MTTASLDFAAARQRLIDLTIERNLRLDTQAQRTELVAEISGIQPEVFTARDRPHGPQAPLRGDNRSSSTIFGDPLYRRYLNNLSVTFAYRKGLYASKHSSYGFLASILGDAFSVPVLAALQDPIVYPPIAESTCEEKDAIFLSIYSHGSPSETSDAARNSYITALTSRKIFEETCKVPSGFGQHAQTEAYRLETEGYEILHSTDVSTVPLNGGRRRTDHIPRLLMKGRHAVVLGEPNSITNQEWRTLVTTIESRHAALSQSAAEDAPDPNTVEMARQLLQAAGGMADHIHKSLDSIRTLESRIEESAFSASRYLESYSAQLRLNLELTEQHAIGSAGAVGRGIDEYLRVAELPDSISSLAGVRSCTIDAGIIKMVTNPYIMRIRGGSFCGRCRDNDMGSCSHFAGDDKFIKIKSQTIQLDTRSDSFGERFVRIVSNNHWHPHVNTGGNGCFGTAASRIAEAWARKDWMSVVHMILQWWTQYNPASPYRRPQASQVVTGYTRPQWIREDEEQPLTAAAIIASEVAAFDGAGLTEASFAEEDTADDPDMDFEVEEGATISVYPASPPIALYVTNSGNPINVTTITNGY